MKTKAILFVIFLTCCIFLSSCSGNSVKPEPTATPVPTSTPAPTPEIYFEDDRAGIKIGDQIITDAIWGEIDILETSKGTRYVVNYGSALEVFGNYGLLDENGNIIVEPTWDYVYRIDGTMDYINTSEGIYDTVNNTIILDKDAMNWDSYDIECINDRFFVWKSRPYDQIEYNKLSGFDQGYNKLSDEELKSIIDKAIRLCSINKSDVWSYSICTSKIYIYDAYNGNFIIDGDRYMLFQYGSMYLYDMDITYNSDNNSFVCEYLKDPFNYQHLRNPDSPITKEISLYYLADRKLAIHITAVGDQPKLTFLSDSLVYTEGGNTLNTYYEIHTFTQNGFGESLEISNRIDENSIYSFDGRKLLLTRAKKESETILVDATNGDIIHLPDVWSYHGFSDGIAAVKNKDGKWGYINTDGELIYDYQFDDASDFNDGKATVITDYKKFTIDKEGNME